MAIPKQNLPPIRACIFDLDGLLINSEDIITRAVNSLLQNYSRPPFTPAIRAKLMGVPGSTNSNTFHDWAQLPISREQFALECAEEMRARFPECVPLPGAEGLLERLSRARSCGDGGERIELALASGTRKETFELKTQGMEVRRLLGFFKEGRVVLGDDERVRTMGRKGKPAPDIYLVALGVLNGRRGEGQREILPCECLVFEDSVVGVEAGRRAGMRVVWVPHADVMGELRERVEEVLAGRMGVEKGDGVEEERVGGLRGELGDGWAECIRSLEFFDYGKYGIEVPDCPRVVPCQIPRYT
ncbi:hypothetical protein AJ79_01592 [Helicocarpus griseus UAMH5409]|uniref:GS1-like protein n=1 Tax=Helicocarpus griseus UAMH5409 TaxID=1447875 RepID=A0A2B7Y6I0_9EURO|nr:hypothetical protein AJ79_01592 [Helicocarpus griseus UAMH5409]